MFAALTCYQNVTFKSLYLGILNFQYPIKQSKIIKLIITLEQKIIQL